MFSRRLACRFWLRLALSGAWAIAACTATVGSGEDGAVRDAAPDAMPDAAVPPPLCSIMLDCGGTPIPDEPKIPCTLTIEDGAGGLLYQGAAGVEKRGRSSLSFPKPQYAVELRTATGVDNPVNLLGMGADPDWVLNGAYIDRALFRNKLLYELFQSLGGEERYAAELAYCELTLEGDWQGVYLLTERVKRDDDRIVIAADNGGGDSFILKQDDQGFREITIAHGLWSLVYPRAELATADQLAGITSWLQSWQDAVSGAGGTDLFDLVDLDSAVDFVLVEELAKNNDAYFLSVHVWKDLGGRLHFTPWDLDLSFGQPLYNESYDPEGWIMYRPPMISAMAARPEFQARLVERWNQLRAGPMSAAAIEASIAFHLETLAPWVDANFDRWPIDEIQFLDNQLYPVTSYAEEIGLVRSWIAARLTWMDQHIAAY